MAITAVSIFVCVCVCVHWNWIHFGRMISAATMFGKLKQNRGRRSEWKWAERENRKGLEPKHYVFVWKVLCVGQNSSTIVSCTQTKFSYIKTSAGRNVPLFENWSVVFLISLRFMWKTTVDQAPKLWKNNRKRDWEKSQHENHKSIHDLGFVCLLFGRNREIKREKERMSEKKTNLKHGNRSSARCNSKFCCSRIWKIEHFRILLFSLKPWLLSLTHKWICIHLINEISIFKCFFSSNLSLSLSAWIWLSWFGHYGNRILWPETDFEVIELPIGSGFKCTLFLLHFHSCTESR